MSDRVARSPEDLLAALRRHLRLLRQFCERAFAAGDHDYLGEVAAKLRLLVIREGRNRPLLLDLMDHYRVTGTSVISGAFTVLEGGPNVGDEVTLDGFFDLPAYRVGEQFVSKRDLIRIWAAQHGAAHEDWTLDANFATARTIFDLSAGRPALSRELETTARSVLEIGEQVVEQIDGIRSQTEGVTMDVHLSRESGRAFHGNFRAPKRSRPVVTATHEDSTAAIAIEAGIGEGGAERIVQTITHLGTTELRGNVEEGARLAFRAVQVPLGTVVISVNWDEPK